MGIFSKIESRVEDTIEGAAGKVPTSSITPAQICKKAEKQMRREVALGTRKQHAPTLYTVLISDEDNEKLFGFYPTLAKETELYLSSKATAAGFKMDGSPLVRFIADPDLKRGKIDIVAELVSAPIVSQLREEEMQRYGIASKKPPQIEKKPVTNRKQADFNIPKKPVQNKKQANFVPIQPVSSAPAEKKRVSAPLPAAAPKPAPTKDAGSTKAKAAVNPPAKKAVKETAKAASEVAKGAVSAVSAASAAPSVSTATPKSETPAKPATTPKHETLAASTKPAATPKHETPAASAKPASNRNSKPLPNQAEKPAPAMVPQRNSGSATQKAATPNNESFFQEIQQQNSSSLVPDTLLFAAHSEKERVSEPIPQTSVMKACMFDTSDNSTHHLTNTRMLMGRDGDNDIVVNDINASRAHAELSYKEPGLWIITDLGSTNGTLINAREIVSQELQDGDYVTIGMTNYVFIQARVDV